MQRWYDLADVPSGTAPSVLTIGNFDGVHLGHVEVLRRVVEVARARQARAVAVTFDPHPLQVLHPERAPRLITGLTQRLDLMARTGLDAVLVQSFTRELAAQTPEQYVTGTFVDLLRAAAVVIGRDVRFGKENSGDLATLEELGKRYGFDVVALEDLGGAGVPADGSRRWSSTWVRELLMVGDVERAAQVLGRPHELAGTVVHGDHRGRELGYPTANLGPGAEGMIPADGVYAGWLCDPQLTDEPAALPAAISVGTNPTFDGVERRVEAYVLDRADLDLYGHAVTVRFQALLRPTVRFDSVDDLVSQMSRDVAAAREVLAL